MSNRKILLAIGILVIVIPFIGVPQTYKNVLLFIVGIVLVLIYVSGKKDNTISEDDEAIYIENEVEETIEEPEATPVTKESEEDPEVIEEEILEEVEEEKTEEESNKFDKYFVDE